MANNVEFVLWGVPAGSADQIDAKILLSNGKSESDCDRVKLLAGRDGWHSFRIQKLNLAAKPDFGANLIKV